MSETTVIDVFFEFPCKSQPQFRMIQAFQSLLDMIQTVAG